MNTDTIAAIATALSDSGIGIIRISGPDAIEVGDSVFRTKSGRHILKEVESHTIHYGYVTDLSSSIVDEVMVSVMKAPKSFTAEDTVEINCHGGVYVTRKILELVCQNGARLAEPGEFTKRAFLNGRIDLSKAEAVMDVIHSQNEMALRSSLDQLRGGLSDEIRSLREQILYEIAFIESALDDPEHVSLEGYPQELAHRTEKIRDRIDRLASTFSDGVLMKEGISTVILGKPNAGKSSLMNLLLGEDRAIVTDIAGTTRDALRETVNLHGVTLNIIDTAGIRSTEDVVERIGVEKARKYAQDADLILCVVDSSTGLDDSDREIFSMVQGKRSIVILNKTDLEPRVDEEDLRSLTENGSFVNICARDGTGLDELEERIRELFFGGMLKSGHETVITSLRHREALKDAGQSLALVMKSIEDGMPEDFYSIDLMNAYTSLGSIIGEEVDDDLMDEIFGKFCMGK